MKYLATFAVFAAVFAFGLAPNARATENDACVNANLQGSFGYTSTGTLTTDYIPAPFAGPFGEIGRQTFDGKGHTQAVATLSTNGSISQAVAIDGTYTVNPDCTGSMILNIPSFGAVVHVDFVIDHHNTEIRAIGTDNGLIETRVYSKQSPEKDDPRE
jgi:hypothetical protein